MKKTLLLVLLMSAGVVHAQSASYSLNGGSTTFTWQKSVGSSVISQATTTVALTQGVDGVLSTSGGVTFSEGLVPTIKTNAEARATYQSFANDVFGMVQNSVTAVRSAVTAYNTASTSLGATAIGAESLTMGAGGVTGTLSNANNATLYGARVTVQTAMNTLHTNVGTANTALSTARSAIASEANLAISGVPQWQALTGSGSAPVGYYRVVQADGSYNHYRIVSTQPLNISNVAAGDSATWTTFGVVNAPVAQFQQNTKVF
jgi:hypothetical protein